MSDIAIGKIIIQDVNNNDQFDSGMDQILDSAGQALPAGQAAVELNQITQEAGVARLGGFSLYEISILINRFRDAENDSQQGRVGQVEISLQDALQTSQNLKIPFNQSRADGILERALKNGITENFRQADSLAQNGQDIDTVKSLMRHAAGYHGRLQKQFNYPGTFNQQKADNILGDSFQNGIPKLESESMLKASQGDFAGALSDLKDLKRLIPEANQQHGFNFKFDLPNAQQTILDAFKNGVPQAFHRSYTLALRGQAKLVRERLHRMEKQTQDANAEFQLSMKFDQSTADQILAEALIHGIPDNFRLATTSARAGNPSSAKNWLNLAQSYVVEYNLKFAKPKYGKPSLVFDQTQAVQIMACARRLGPCP